MARIPESVVRKDLAKMMATASAQGKEVYVVEKSVNLDNCTDVVELQVGILFNFL